MSIERVEARRNPFTRRPAGLAALLAIALVVALGSALASGSYQIPLPDLPAVLWRGVSGGAPSDGTTAELVVSQVRLPRVLAAALAGAALAMAGAGMQAVFRNPLAAPDLLGVSSGAAFGAVAGIFLGWSMVSIQLAAFAGGIAAVALVWAVSARLRGAERTLTLILCGIAVGSLLSAGVALFKYVADPGSQLPAITFWLLGSFSGVSAAETVALALTAVPAAVVLAGLGWRVDLLLLTDDEVRTSGVDAARLRGTVIVACTLAASGAVAVAGVIGWIGLIVPHAVRLAIGGGFARSMPATMLAGALLMVVVDTLARGAFETEVPPGVLMAMIGAPALFALLALRPAR